MREPNKILQVIAAYAPKPENRRSAKGKLMITRLEQIEANAQHDWTINDRVNQNHFDWINHVAPCIINLYWKENDAAPKQFIGTYNLNLEALLEAGYLRTDLAHSNQVFLRFQRNNDNKIQIALNENSKTIDCGIVIRT